MLQRGYHPWHRLCSLILCIALLCGIFSGCQKREEVPQVDPSLLTVTPSSETDGVIPVDARFHIRYEGGKLSESSVQALFRLEPEAEFEVESDGDGFNLIPASPFEQNKVINLKAVDQKGVTLRSWAYQTQTAFSVLRTTPGDSRSYVPVDTGVEVVFSYADVDAAAFQQCFSLTAVGEETPVEGSVEKHGDTLVFVPSEPLQTTTVYHAVISGELSSPAGDTLGQDVSFSFKTADATKGGRGDSYFENASPIAETFAAGDAPLIAVSCGDVYTQGPSMTQVSVYRFQNADDYAAELQKLAQERNGSAFPDDVKPQVDTGKLDSLGTFEVPVTVPQSDSYWGPKYLILPGEYEEGWYYFQVSVQDPVLGTERTLQKFIQVSPVSVYAMQTGEDAVFWLHDTATGEPITGANISLSGGAEAAGSSDAEGLAALKAPAKEEGSWCTLRIESGEEVYLDLYQPRPAHEKTASERYVSYLYTDRPIYMSSDTIHVWGLVRPRAGTSEAPENLRLMIGDVTDRLYETPVTLGNDGTFSAEIPFEKLGGKNISYTQVQLVCGEEETLAHVSVEIGDYVKPVYLPSASWDKTIYQAGDQAKLTFSSTFFDNTPAAGFSANLQISYGGIEPILMTTGEDGKVTTEVTLPSAREEGGYDENSWRPTSIWYDISNASGENENFSLYSSIPVLFRDRALRGTLEGKGEERKVTISLNEIDTSRVLTEEDAYQDENLIGAPVDGPVTVEVHKEYYVKTPSGSYYDFVQKRNVTSYDYEYHDDVVSSETYETSGGVYTFTDLPRQQEDETYYLLLKAQDSQGRPVEERVWLGFSEGRYYQGTHRYTFLKEGANQDDYTSRYFFDEGENLHFNLMDNGAAVQEGKALWLVIQDGVLSAHVTNADKIDLPYSEELVPNYTLAGAYFSGKYVYRIEEQGMRFNPDKRALDLTVTADREEYAPGDTAKLEVSATYQKDGQPAKGAAVSLSLVDEAVFAIQEQEADPLSRLYASVYYPEVSTYLSYREYNFLGDAAGEKGGGGGEGGVRSDFQDTAAFLTAVADENGHASFEVTLPDNITSFRATAQAITEDLYAGSSRAAVVCTREFFLNEVLATQYLEGDDANLTVRCAGGGITSESPVDYTLTLEGNGGKQEASASGKAGDFTVLPMGKLQKGSYTLTLTAKSGEYEDAIEKTFDVLSSGVEATLHRTFNLADGVDIEAQKFPVLLGFYDSSYAFYAEVLGEMSAASGSRADERIARKLAREKMQELMGGEEKASLWHDEDDLSDVLDTSGYVSLFPYDSPDTLLSAKVHLAAPDYLIGGRPIGVFTNVLGSSGMDTDEMAAAYLGMAAHHEPVLGQVRSLLGNPTGYSEKGQLLLLAALAALGDSTMAEEYYEKLITPKLVSGKTGAGEETLCYDKGDINESLEYTALSSLAASILRRPEAEGMLRYLMDNRSTENLYYLEEAVYLRYMEPTGAEKAVVSYQKGGKKTKLELDKTGMAFVRFTSEDFDPASIKAESGEVCAKAYYIGSLEEACEQENREIELTKSYALSEGSGEFKNGDVLKVTIQVKMDEHINPDFLIVDDYIPSGMRYLGMGSEVSLSGGKGINNWELVSREGQRVSFRYRDYQDGMPQEDEGAPQPGSETYEPVTELTYYVRCAAPGNYVVDSAYAQAALSPAWGMSERSAVSILEE